MTARKRNPFPTHGLVCNADDRNHLMVCDLSQPSPMMILHLIDRLQNSDPRSALVRIHDHCLEAMKRETDAATRDELAQVAAYCDERIASRKTRRSKQAE